MPDLVPSGYLTIREALNRLGHELFGSDWTGEEHKARRGLMSEDEWLRIKDLPPARGGGDALASGRSMKTLAAKPAPHTSDPSDPLYQKGVQGEAAIRGCTPSVASTARGRSARGCHIGSLHRQSASSVRITMASA